MEIIDNISTKPPKFVAPSELPVFRTTYENESYWAEEHRRWIEGYAGLTGRQYCYITVGKLQTIEGSHIRPDWRDGDEFVFQEDELARKHYEDTLIVKRREFGLTSIFGGFEPLYNSLVTPGCVNLLTSADSERVKNLFSDKVMVMYENLHDDIRPTRLYERVAGLLRFGIRDKKDKKGKIQGNSSQIICRETADNDTAAKSFEAYRAMYAFLDELFLHPRANIVRNSAQASLSKGFVKRGHMVIGGSCGYDNVKDADNAKKGAVLGEQLWRDSEALGIKTIFLPATLCISEAPEYDKNGKPTGKILNFCINGHSNEAAAKEWVLRRRDQLEKAKDKSAFLNFCKQYPLTIDEVFEINRQGVFPKEIYENLATAQKEINEGANAVFQTDLYRDFDNTIKTRPNKNGKFFILTPPQTNGEYIAGQDPIPFNEADINDGSDQVITIKERFSETYVAAYCERSLDADVVVNNAILLQEWYKSKNYPQGAPCNLEMNHGGVTKRIYEESGKSHLLSNRPTHLGIEYEDKRIKKGWKAGGKTSDRVNKYLVQYLLKHAAKMRFQRGIDELKRFPEGNNDFVDAMRSCEMLDAELTEIGKKYSYQPNTNRWVRYVTRDENGKTKTEWVQVPR